MLNMPSNTPRPGRHPVRATLRSLGSATLLLAMAEASHAAGTLPAPLETIPLLLAAALGVVLLRGLRD